MLFNCPHCNGAIEIQRDQFNCRIIRHAVYVKNGQQINPHASKAECDRLVEQKLVHGCARPSKIVVSGNGFKLEKCGYI